MNQVQAEPRIDRKDQRWKTFTYPLQVRMLGITISYSLIIFVMLASPLFTPMMYALDDRSLSWQEKAVVANDLLNLNARYWPWALGAGIILLIHCVHSVLIVNQMTAQFRAKICAIKTAQASDDTIAELGKKTERNLAHLNASLDSFRTDKG